MIEAIISVMIIDTEKTSLQIRYVLIYEIEICACEFLVFWLDVWYESVDHLIVLVSEDTSAVLLYTGKW